jgi:succinoglycan biosynthesis protein ExoA
MTSQIPGLVSVLMPVRNEADSVEGAVASVLGQAYPSLELLVVDGRSDDATAAIVERLAAADPRIRLLDNPARGIATGLNVGLDAARGEFVARVDAHLLSAPDLAAVGGRRTGVAGTTTGRAIALALSSPFGVGNSINHYGTEVQPTDHASFGVYRASVARQVGGWDPALAVNEDVDFDFRILAAGYGIRYDPAMVISWHVRENLRDLGRQYRRYGRGKGAMVRKNGPSAVRPRHLAAPALVGTLALSGVAVLVRRPAVAVLLTAPYVVAVGAASIVTWRRAVAAGQSAGVDPGTLPGAFVAMHTGWGLGFLEGLAGRAPHATSKRDPAAVVS